MVYIYEEKIYKLEEQFQVRIHYKSIPSSNSLLSLFYFFLRLLLLPSILNSIVARLGKPSELPCYVEHLS